MLSAKEAFEKRVARSSEAVADSLRSAVGTVIELSDDRPEVIVGGQWPCKIHGACREICVKCGAFVALSPDSGLQAVRKWPEAPVVCWVCALKMAEAEAQAEKESRA